MKKYIKKWIKDIKHDLKICSNVECASCLALEEVKKRFEKDLILIKEKKREKILNSVLNKSKTSAHVQELKQEFFCSTSKFKNSILINFDTIGEFSEELKKELFNAKTLEEIIQILKNLK